MNLKDPMVCLSAKVMSHSKSDYSISIKIMWTGQAGSVWKLPGIFPSLMGEIG